jgi:hypothetical protein
MAMEPAPVKSNAPVAVAWKNWLRGKIELENFMCQPGCESICIEISAATLKRLLADGHVGAAELRCLDGASRHCLRRLCLKSCVRCERAGQCAMQGMCPSVQRSSRESLS